MNTVYVINCRTGCTCCRSENHIRGIYRTPEEAKARVARFRGGTDYPVASQYSRTGCYSIEELSCENLSGGRIIVGGDKVYLVSKLLSVDLRDGSVDKDDYLESLNE